MNIWRDSKGREWAAHLDLGLCLALRKNLGVDLLDESKASGLAMLLVQREKLGNVLWLIHQEQAEASGIDRDGFMAGLDYDAMAAAFGGLADAFADFCPPPTRDGVRRMIEMETEAMAKVGQIIADQIQAVETEAEIAEAAQQTAAAICGLK